MAAALEEQLGIEADLVPGHGGVFEVSVDGRIVAWKSLHGFPSEEECVRAVREALGGQAPT